ncbi:MULTISPECIES: calmodulin [Pseudoalteromonas]|jgi:Ca2+-binding EF-hand superfamily protein|uniref:EF-hand domain-containing protein n=2 Tax=Pseudoalteromonas TaxID=53246 RepID=A0A8I2H2I6_9GAMM|nr:MULTISPECIES: calmodulin [Pseudoalteromonas]ASD69471.1 calmodulin [Pseudoalteromonas piscicida]AUJ72345.1 EF hand [Pseudoalteromonas sp. NC201]AXR04169.1 EF-hand domain-containing protein [Pseudoalteromonas piscicida]KID33680.1 calmodulin [Pseudoalteromonas flavipulchra NCIMB 2033 = ATCC BAA-314]KJY87829.1 calmodulin [Pseudoalteromonas piscicida]
MKNVLAALSIAGLTFASASALAGEDFTKYDTDGNGTISMTEAKVNQSLAEQFTQLDSNADGELSESEFANYQG